MITHISVVMAVRTARALDRAVSMHDLIEAGLSGEATMNSTTLSRVAVSYLALNWSAHAAVATALSHSLDEPA